MNELKQQAIAEFNQESYPVIEAGFNGLSKMTQEEYSRDFKTFNSVINKDIQEVKPGDILGYIRTLESKGLKNSTINRKIYSLSKILNLYKLQGLIRINVISELNKIKTIAKPVNNQISCQLEIADIQNTTRKKNKTTIFIKALSQTGCRISELINIKTNDIKDFSIEGKAFKEIQITGKGKKERKIFITAELYQDIKRIYGKSKNGYLFQSRTGKPLNRRNLYSQIRSAFKKYTGKRINPHMIRHFFAGYKIQYEKKDLKSISSYLGHSSITTTGNMYLKGILNPVELVLSV